MPHENHQKPKDTLGQIEAKETTQAYQARFLFKYIAQDISSDVD